MVLSPSNGVPTGNPKDFDRMGEHLFQMSNNRKGSAPEKSLLGLRKEENELRGYATPKYSRPSAPPTPCGKWTRNHASAAGVVECPGNRGGWTHQGLV